jgi:hypothetical protein
MGNREASGIETGVRVHAREPMCPDARFAVRGLVGLRLRLGEAGLEACSYIWSAAARDSGLVEDGFDGVAEGADFEGLGEDGVGDAL